jgi:hypothetical protein
LLKKCEKNVFTLKNAFLPSPISDEEDEEEIENGSFFLVLMKN